MNDEPILFLLGSQSDVYNSNTSPNKFINYHFYSKIYYQDCLNSFPQTEIMLMLGGLFLARV